MTSQEEQMLNSLVERVNSTQLTEKDPEAGALLQEGFARNPDAVYVLAQSVLVQNIALEQAHAQLMDAREQLRQAQQTAQQTTQQVAQQRTQSGRATSFLGSLLGHREVAPVPTQVAQQPAYQPVYTPQAAPEYQAPYAGPYPGQPYPGQPYPGQPYQGQPYGGPQYGGPQYGVPQQPSFLRSAAQTAAGVAAGALAFEGVEALLHGGFGHPGMGMGMGGWGMPGVGFGMGPGMGMGMGFERPMEETVINNYYDSRGGEHGGHEHHLHESASDGGAQVSDASWDGNSGGGWDSGSGSDDSSLIGDDGSFDGDGGVL